MKIVNYNGASGSGKKIRLTKSENVKVSNTQHIAIIGGGPKAVAIATKAQALRDLKIKDVRITIIEPTCIGASWNGLNGFTDGKQQLCTIAERDVGFPYINDRYSMSGADVASAMQAFSWQTFLLRAQEKTDKRPYSFGEWTDRGRKPPKHQDFASYLNWALKQTDFNQVKGWARDLKAEGEKWKVRVATDTSNGVGLELSQNFDGIVVTGTGPARRVPVTDERKTAIGRSSIPIFDGSDFWKRTDEVLSLLKTKVDPKDQYLGEILIIGGGGTAAAILAWLLSNGGEGRAIRLLAGQASLHTRVDSVFENKLFSDSDQWDELSRVNQQAFFNRLNRGVVWDTVIDKVSAAERLKIQDARAKRVVIRKDGTIWVDLKLGNGLRTSAEPAILIDASGFDARWFKTLLGVSMPDMETFADLEESMDDYLAFNGDDWKLPRFHAPMLSSRKGPGFASLMVLGAMADRVLAAY